MGHSAAPPFRAEHVGSLLRPKHLLGAREAVAEGRMSREDLRAIEDDAIRDAIRLQEDVGLRVVTDGEFRRESWHMDFIYSIGGIRQMPSKMKVQFHNEQGDIEFTPILPEVYERVRLDRVIFADDFTFVKEHTRVTPKLSIPSPNMIHFRGGRDSVRPEAYEDIEDYWRDISKVYADQLAGLAKIGCTYVQIDDTSLASLNDPRQRELVASLGGDPDRQHETYIRVLNDALADKPESMTVGTHSCRGNYMSSWTSEGGYDFVAEAFFGELAVDVFFLEYDDSRSGGFEPLRFVPKDKHVVLGLVTTKKPLLESGDDLKRRIDEASRYVPLDRLSLSPQCGFASMKEGNAVTVDDEIAKLRLVVDVATEVWGTA